MPKHTFHLKYAPHFGSFKELAGPDPIDQLKFIADQGFTAFEENGLGTRPVGEQEKIAAEMQRLGLQMGVFSASKLMGQPNFVSAADDVRQN
ncbi:MAG: xylose isomerase, partial [Candidatus Sumerlaeota bacterium]|nr:xylose isomerase [Candidatus Sumerlaeota bacterium]